jgi:sugar-specific transcriptional regulator TrmB
MSRNLTIEKLKRLGLNVYEAKSYIALLTMRTGNGYTIAKKSGIPTSKVYEALAGLSEKDFIFSDGMKNPQYTAKQPGEVLGGIKEDISAKISELIPELELIAVEPKDIRVQSINGREKVFEAVKKLIDEAEQKILLTAWTEDLEDLKSCIAKKVKRNSVIILANGDFELKGAEIFVHRRTDLVKDYLQARWLLAVSEKEGVAVCFDSSGEAQCIWTENPGIYKIFADHILHDVSLNYVISKLPESAKDDLEGALIEIRKKLQIK